MISVLRALELVHETCTPLDDETIPIDQAIGRVLREPIDAPHAFPPFDRVMMDGYALRAADLGDGRDALVPIGEAAPAAGFAGTVLPGTCVYVTTGAPLPEGADAVMPVEEAEDLGGRVRFRRAARPGDHFAARGEEAKQGARLLNEGDEVSAVGVAVLASCGRTAVRVGQVPSVAIVVTGNELVPAEGIPGRTEIRDSNSWSLAAQARAEGLRRVRRLHARDVAAELSAVLAEAMTDDLVIVSGGVSRGKYDLVPEILASLGVEQVFHSVFQKPGKPLWFGKRGRTVVFGAPGNPLATVIAFDLYVRAAIARVSGRRAVFPSLAGRLTDDMTVRCDRDLHLFVRASWATGDYGVSPLRGRGSADVFGHATANAVLPFTAGRHELKRGQEVRFYFLGLTPGA